MRRKRCRGFNLIELVTVLMIIGILASMAIPRFANYTAHQRASAAAGRVAADLNYARQHAAQTSIAQTVTFDVPANRYELVGIQHPDRPADPYVVLLSGGLYQATIVSAGFGGDAEVVFDLYEKPDSGGQVVVQVGSWQETVSLDAETGKAEVQ